jgi:peptidyl-prolyl cis-trans isomerase C
MKFFRKIGDDEMAKINCAHILVQTEEQAREIMRKLEDGEPFEELAKGYSLCPSGQNGGNLGDFERGDMVKEFEDAAFSSDVGEIVGPIKTQFGYHIIKRLR